MIGAGEVPSSALIGRVLALCNESSQAFEIVHSCQKSEEIELDSLCYGEVVRCAMANGEGVEQAVVLFKEVWPTRLLMQEPAGAVGIATAPVTPSALA